MKHDEKSCPAGPPAPPRFAALFGCAFIVAVAAAAVAGCGQKGPLVLPDARPAPGAADPERDDESSDDEARDRSRRGAAGDFTDGR